MRAVCTSLKASASRTPMPATSAVHAGSAAPSLISATAFLSWASADVDISSSLTREVPVAAQPATRNAMPTIAARPNAINIAGIPDGHQRPGT